MPQKQTKKEKIIYWSISLLIVFVTPYLILFVLDIGLNKFQPLGLVIGSLIYTLIGFTAVVVLASIFSSVAERLKNLELIEGKKRYWKEIIIYFLIAFTAITAYNSKSIVEFLSAMLVAGIGTQVVVFVKDLIKQFGKKEK